jgi:HEAT repeat protein
MGRWAQGNAELARIRELEHNRNVAGLIAELGNDASYGRYSIIRSHAADALGRLGDTRAVPYLSELAQDPEPDARHSAVGALGELKARGAAPIMRRCLRDPVAIVRMVAAESLGRVGDAESIPDLREVLDADPNAEVRLAAAQALVDLGDRRVYGRLEQALNDVSWLVRRNPENRKLKRLANEYARSAEGS